MIFGVELEHGADVDGADDVDVVEEEGLVEILWIFEEEPGGFFQAAAGVEEDFFAGDFNAHAEIFVRFEIVDDLVGEVVDVDDDFGDAEGAETRESDFEESAAGEFDEGFGAIVRERAEARAEAGAKDHGFHGSDPEASERFLSAQADRLAGASRKEKASACSVRNDRR